MRQEINDIWMFLCRKDVQKGILALLIIFLLKQCYNYVDEKETETFKKNMGFAKAQIIGISPGYRSSKYFDWKVYILKDTFDTFTRFYICEEKMIGRWFPVVYNIDNPKDYEILYTREEFGKYSVPFPDSLKWLLDCRRWSGQNY